jgi:zinc transporter ZupT
MMMAASAALVVEAVQDNGLGLQQSYVALLVAAGAALGVLFIVVSKRWLAEHEELKFYGIKGVDRSVQRSQRACRDVMQWGGDCCGVAGASARKMLLIIAVMFAHSVSEGVRYRCAGLQSLCAGTRPHRVCVSLWYGLRFHSDALAACTFV